MKTALRAAFDSIGAAVEFDTLPAAFEIDVAQRDHRESYVLRYPLNDTIDAKALDVKPHLRHLVLDVTGYWLPISGRYLCGHDEFHWFVAQLPFHRRTATVRGAMEMLKPLAVLRAQKRLGFKHGRHRRKTAAYVRQGEWFFLPRPKMHVEESLCERNSQLVRFGGKPHQVEWLFRSADEDFTFVRGKVAHPDHATLNLEAWHRVEQNAERESIPTPRSHTWMAYVD